LRSAIIGPSDAPSLQQSLFPGAKYLELLEDVMLPARPNRNPVPRRSVPVFCTLLSFLLVLSCNVWAQAQTSDLVRTPVNLADRVPLTGHHPAWANPQNDVGALPADLSIERLTLVLARPLQREQAYTQFLQDQQTPGSHNYHHWLTPVEIGKRFGVSSHDIHAVTAWLQSQGLQVDSVSNSQERILFSGSASAIANAFGTEMHYFMVSGEKRISITADPQIPSALGQVVKSISGLFTVKYYAQHGAETVHAQSHNLAPDSGVNPTPDATFCNGSVCQNVIFPADFATIYNTNGITGGINGAGQTIAIVGRSRVCTADITNFATQAAVTANVPTVIVPSAGIDPGPAACSGSASGDQSEATLDVTRSGSIAQGATILLVASADSQTADGIGTDVQYIVDTNPVPAEIMSISFGGCEAQGGQSEVSFWDALFKQGAGEGISVFVSSGDSGAAGCDQSFAPPPVTQVASPNAICSSSYATCVGGTEFADSNPNLYWSPNNGNGFESALGYIPEGAWNEPMNGTKFQVAGTGGGVSSFIATPTWQVGTGVPPGRTGRYTPDVAFSASGHDGYFGCLAASGGSCVVTNGSFSFEIFSGTSASAPDMAGITALLDQKEGAGQGTLNPSLYNLAATTSNGVFNDVTVTSSGVSGCVVTTASMCNNSTPSQTSLMNGQQGYLVTTGYDEATGLGSINIANLLTSWVSTVAVTTTKLTSLAPASVPAGSTGPVVLTASVTSGGGTPTGSVNFFNGGAVIGTGVLSNGTATFSYNPSALAAGSYSITAGYPWNSTFGNSTSTAQTLNVQGFKIAASPPIVTITAPGQSGTTTLTVTPLGGFSQTISYSCNSTTLPSEASCTFAAASATTETLTITTTAASTGLNRSPFGRGNGIFYALLLPGVLGLMLSAGNRKRPLRGGRALGLVVVLTVTLWAAGCGGGGSSSGGGGTSNPGTPAGTSSVTVTATAGSVSNPVQITLTVQ
jgi:pseudomonalisin